MSGALWWDTIKGERRHIDVGVRRKSSERGQWSSKRVESSTGFSWNRQPIGSSRFASDWSRAAVLELAHAVDRVVSGVETDKTSRHTASTAIEELSRFGVGISAIVLNKRLYHLPR